jgi:hypothetical protein
MRLSLVWWNTSLSPAGKSRATKEQTSLACALVDFILHQMAVDFIALGEINEKDAGDIRARCNLEGYELCKAFSKVGRSQFDMCFLYNFEKLNLFDEVRPISSFKGNRCLKIAQQLDFKIANYGKPLHIFVSHWPSLLRCPRNSPDRAHLGMRLRDSVMSLNPQSTPPGNVILMGDYNDEPFDVSLAEHLMATRDRHLVKKRPHLLYNPFWRKLGFSEPYLSQREEDELGGTYFYKGGEATCWHTFDQILFSSEFLGSGDWQLVEGMTGLLNIPGYKSLVVNKNEIFDHFPVISVIEKVDDNG